MYNGSHGSFTEPWASDAQEGNVASIARGVRYGTCSAQVVLIARKFSSFLPHSANPSQDSHMFRSTNYSTWIPRIIRSWIPKSWSSQLHSRPVCYSRSFYWKYPQPRKMFSNHKIKRYNRLTSTTSLPRKLAAFPRNPKHPQTLQPPSLGANQRLHCSICRWNFAKRSTLYRCHRHRLGYTS